MPLLLALLLIPLGVIVLIPVSLVLRIRRGTMRRQARGWVVTANTIAVAFSTAMFLTSALITSRWVPDALRYSLGGLGLGAVIGLIGFALTRWESSRGVVHYESLARADRDDRRRRAHLLWYVARVGGVAGWHRGDRDRGCVRDSDVDRGKRGRRDAVLRPTAEGKGARHNDGGDEKPEGNRAVHQGAHVGARWGE